MSSKVNEKNKGRLLELLSSGKSSLPKTKVKGEDYVMGDGHLQWVMKGFPHQLCLRFQSILSHLDVLQTGYGYLPVIGMWVCMGSGWVASHHLQAHLSLIPGLTKRWLPG